MGQVDNAVLEALKRDIMKPVAIERAFRKLHDHLTKPPKPESTDPKRELARLDRELHA